MRAINSGLLALLVPFITLASACPTVDSDTGSDTHTGETGDDTSVDGVAPVTPSVYRLGILTTETWVTLTGPTKVYDVQSGITQEVDAPGAYTAEAGDEVPEFFFLVEETNDGYWATPIGDFSVQLNVPASVRLDQFKLPVPAEYNCGYDAWGYDSSAADHKGVSDGYYDLGHQRIDVDHDGYLLPQDGVGSLGIFEGTDRPRFVDDGMTLQDDSTGDITEAATENDSFEATRVITDWSVTTLRCDKR